MKTEINQAIIVHYSNDLHDKLLLFLKKEYPFRTEDYLEFCLDYLDNATKEVKEKAVIALINSEIVGCYTVLPLQMISDNRREDYYIQVNMIVSPQHRGIGISSLLYHFLDFYPNWMVTGFTEMAWEIASRKVKSFNPIAPIYVYLMFNKWIPITILKKMKLMGKTRGLKPFPESSKLSSFTMQRAYKVSDIFFPSSGRWFQSDTEIIRDGKYLEERFFTHYRNNEYIVYSLHKKNMPIGYFVVRVTEYHGFQMLSLVDFRYTQGGNMADVLKAVTYVAQKTHYGMGIVLTSFRLHRLTLSPLVFRTTKELPCATGVKNLAKQNYFLFTSADSDLDYVYYK